MTLLTNDPIRPWADLPGATRTSPRTWSPRAIIRAASRTRRACAASTKARALLTRGATPEPSGPGVVLSGGSSSLR
jgi:hypothetical protein